MLSGRWHRSTRFFMAGVLLFLLFCNVPGQLTNRLYIGGKDENYPLVADFGYTTRFEHGWPFTYLAREPELTNASWGPCIAENVVDCWTLWLGVEQFSLSSLLLNAVLGVIAAAASGLVFEIWRRRHQHWWQFHLSDMFISTAIVCVFGAWYAEKQRHAATISEITRTQPTIGPSWKSYEAGPSWLRWWIGEIPFRNLDEEFEVTVYESEYLPMVARVATLEYVDIACDVNTERLKCLEDLPRLTMLNLENADLVIEENSIPQADNQVLVLPVLPKLRALSISHTRYRSEGIGRLSSLEVLNLYYTMSNDQTLAEVSQCRRLKELDLGTLKISSQGISSLQALPELCRLRLEYATLDDGAMQELGRLVHLQYLSLDGGEFSAASLHHLANLTLLHSLSLEDTLTDDVALEKLLLLPSLRHLYLSNTNVTEKSLATLQKMKQLRNLVLPSEKFSVTSQKALQETLSSCDVSYYPPH